MSIVRSEGKPRMAWYTIGRYLLMSLALILYFGGCIGLTYFLITRMGPTDNNNPNTCSQGCCKTLCCAICTKCNYDCGKYN